MRYVRFIGGEQQEEYHGTDDGTNLDMLPGDVRGVSDAKAGQLERDFGDLGTFEFDVDPDEVYAPVERLDPITQLKRLKMPQLIEAAGYAGVDAETREGWTKPGTSKDKVIEGIAAEKDLADVVEIDEVRVLLEQTVATPA